MKRAPWYGWIETYTGRRVSLLDPQPGEISIVDIAHALSLICRYNGHCERFYSVAEHSVRMALATSPEDWQLRRELLLHDAAEAYLGDMCTPVKALIPDFKDIEQRFESVIGRVFGVGGDYYKGVVKSFDRMACVTEHGALMTLCVSDDWGFIDDPLPVEGALGWSPGAAEKRFLNLWQTLEDARRSDLRAVMQEMA